MIYFIRSGISGPVKIGYSKDISGVTSRLSSLQVGNSKKLSIIGIITGDMKKEAELHKTFAAHKIRGEWFKSNSDLLAYISMCDLITTQDIYDTGVCIDNILDTVEEYYIKWALDRSNGDKRASAKLLGIKYRSFRYRFDKLYD